MVRRHDFRRLTYETLLLRWRGSVVAVGVTKRCSGCQLRCSVCIDGVVVALLLLWVHLRRATELLWVLFRTGSIVVAQLRRLPSRAIVAFVALLLLLIVRCIASGIDGCTLLLLLLLPRGAALIQMRVQACTDASLTSMTVRLCAVDLGRGVSNFAHAISRCLDATSNAAVGLESMTVRRRPAAAKDGGCRAVGVVVICLEGEPLNLTLLLCTSANWKQDDVDCEVKERCETC